MDFAELKSPRDSFAMKGEDSADREVVGEATGREMLCAGAKFGRDVVSTLIVEKHLASSMLDVRKCTYLDPSTRGAIDAKSMVLYSSK